MEHARAEQFAALPADAVVFNAIGDADAALASLAQVEAFLAQCRRPVLNPPAGAGHRPRPLGRDPGRGRRRDRPADGARGGRRPSPPRGRSRRCWCGPRSARRRGSRAPGRRGGARSGAPGAGEVYVTGFPTRARPTASSAKYRAIFVDRRAFPYHLAISPHWMTHHQSSGMAGRRRAWRRNWPFCAIRGRDRRAGLVRRRGDRTAARPRLCRRRLRGHSRTAECWSSRPMRPC